MNLRNTGIALLLASSALLAGCGERVLYGEAGVEVKETGSQAGVQKAVITTGRYWNHWWSYRYLVKFPTQQQTFDRKQLNCFEYINADRVRTVQCLSMNVQAQRDMGPIFVEKFRGQVAKGGGEDGYVLDDIVIGPMRREIQNAFAIYGPKWTSEALYADGGNGLLQQVKGNVKPRFDRYGIVINDMLAAGVPVLPNDITASIKGALKAKTDATKNQAEVANRIAIGNQKRADADADAYALDTTGAALRRNPEALTKLELERSWGLCPRNASVCVIGGDAPVITRTFDQDGRYK